MSRLIGVTDAFIAAGVCRPRRRLRRAAFREGLAVADAWRLIASVESARFIAVAVPTTKVSEFLGIVDYWYSEICTYYYPSPMKKNIIGHFTQIVWKASRRIGSGIARSRKGVYVASFYTPAGNNPVLMKENVPAPIAGRPSRRNCRAMK
ncbi:hypothetical protein HPB51_024554 [Rhipicephalus microplus]|uniref:SCP domain-containing protein n=1 Tax=Rhipicephalus microplus TaxID=6941 RepID=A0A9J6DJZ9_RHIMP|nr:hypothetical protein HPB51_024554 [Rhipicephalus microplus]